MKAIGMMGAAIAAAGLTMLAAADVPDLTAQMEYLCNPNASR